MDARAEDWKKRKENPNNQKTRGFLGLFPTYEEDNLENRQKRMYAARKARAAEIQAKHDDDIAQRKFLVERASQPRDGSTEKAPAPMDGSEPESYSEPQSQARDQFASDPEYATQPPPAEAQPQVQAASQQPMAKNPRAQVADGPAVQVPLDHWSQNPAAHLDAGSTAPAAYQMSQDGLDPSIYSQPMSSGGQSYVPQGMAAGQQMSRSPAGTGAPVYADQQGGDQFVMPPLSEMVAPNGGAYAGMEDRAPASAQGKPVYYHYSTKERPFYAGYKYGWIPYPTRPGQKQQAGGQAGQAGQSGQMGGRAPAGMGQPQYAPQGATGASGYSGQASSQGSTSPAPDYWAPDQGDTDYSGSEYGDLGVSQMGNGQSAWMGDVPKTESQSVRIMAPDGSVRLVPAGHVQAAMAAGGRRV